MESREILMKSSKTMLVEGKNLEYVLGFLRQNGCSKTQSIIILKEIKEISLDEAKELVHFSEVWQDVSKVDEKLINNFYETAIKNDI
jgi:ribosomal protein L7/L12